MNDLKAFLDAKVAQYNRPEFIAPDPVSIPHRFSQRQDIEIMGFWAAMLAWGQRKTIISKAGELITLMDGAPYDFVRNHAATDLKRFLSFRHRTFNATDARYFLAFFRHYYARHDSLEDAFLPADPTTPHPVEAGLRRFHDLFFSLEDAPLRTRKHVATPARKAACKRINMFLRWMVRRDDRGVDFGLWKRITPAQLICPCDVHVDRVARKLGLIRRRPTDWLTAVELTDSLRELDPADPVQYDFALFGLGIEGKM
ncbi:MAG: TIGR02757 family protein [Ferruginibacter sp.]|nr:TIGR02757 family protein [Cytophagales bacterium]